MGFPDSSVGKESACNAGDHSLIPGLGRSAGEGIGHPLQYSWASLVAQLVKNPPAMWETWVWSLGWEDTLEKGKATHSNILAWRLPWTIQSLGSQRVRRDFHFQTFSSYSLFDPVHWRQQKNTPLPKDVSILTPNTCDYVTLLDKREFSGMIKLRLLKWKLMVDHPRRPNVITKVLRRGKQEK